MDEGSGSLLPMGITDALSPIYVSVLQSKIKQDKIAVALLVLTRN